MDLNKANKNLLIIFTRNIELGKCKTRLARTIGPQKALELYKMLVAHTATISRLVNADKCVYYSEFPEINDYFEDNVYSKYQQKGSDLGERMRHAIGAGFKSGYSKVIIIGSDIYDLDTKDIEASFEALNENDFVIGPAQDGGYYLLGMKKHNQAIFENKNWGTSTVLKDTLRDLEGESLMLRPVRNDVDVYEDIKNIPAFQRFLID